MFYRILVYFFGCIFIFPLLSQEIPKKTSNKITVLGRVTKLQNQKESDSSGFVRIINKSEFEGKYTSLAEILEEESGIKIKRYGGLGSYSTLSIRGANSNQIRFYINGIPINNHITSEVNLAELPFDNLERIEIYKSGSSFGFSSSDIGGTINLVTKNDSLKKSTKINLGGGSYKTFKFSSSLSNYTKKSQYSFFVQKEKSDQNFTFWNDNGTPVLNTLDDFKDKRKNAQFDRYTANINYQYKNKKTVFSVMNNSLYLENGLSGSISNEINKVKTKTVKNTTSLGTKSKEFLQPFINLKTRSYYTQFQANLFDPKDELGYNTGSKTTFRNYGFHFLPEFHFFQIKPKQTIRIFASKEKEYFNQDKRNNLDQVVKKIPESSRSIDNFQIQDEFIFLNHKLKIPLVYQQEYYTDYFKKDIDYSALYNREKEIFKKRIINHRIGFAWLISSKGNKKFKIKSNFSKNHRMPNFWEIFGQSGTIIGNQNLDPEKSENIDLGFIYESFKKKKSHYLEFAFFEKNIEDMILFIPNSQFTLRAENIDKAKIQGFEISEKLNWSFFQFQFSYTYQKALNKSEIKSLKNKYLPLRPMHDFSGSITYKNKLYKITWKTIFIGAVFRDRTNEYFSYEPSRTLHNISFNWYLKKLKNHKLSLEIKNITNKKTFDVTGYPLPGRSFYMFYSIKF